MARKSGGTILQEELYPPSAALAREELDDARLVDLDVAEESPFLRGQKRVSARRSSLPKKTASRLLWVCLAAAILCIGAIAAGSLYEYGERSWRFRVASSDNIEVSGMQNVTKAQIMEVMGADIGRNIFFIPLAQQKTQLEQIPWVESASVMRFVPNRITVEIHERTPIAFARVGPRISLIDSGGTLMELPQKHKYSFPVILGMNPGEPLSTRAPRMRAYNELVQELDSGGARYSQDLSEVDLTDLENLKVRVNDPHGDVLVELGSSDFLKRYKTYVSHVQDWRQQFHMLESVNLRYDNQVIVNPEIEGKPRESALSASTARAAAAAGVKPAALITHMNPHERMVSATPSGTLSGTLPRSLPKPAFELIGKKVDSKSVAAKKPAVRPRAKKASVKSKNAARKKVPAKTASQTKTREMTAHAKGREPATSKPAIPKPSAAIAKPQPNTSSD